MNSLVITIVCVVTCLCVIIRYRSFLHPLFLFNAIWMLISFLNSFHLYELNKADEEIYGYILCGILVFNICYELWFSFRKKNRIKWCSFRKASNFTIRSRLIYFFVIVCFIYYLAAAFETISTLVAGGTLATVRESVQNAERGTSFVSKIVNAFRILFIIPIGQVIPVACVVNYWFGNRDKKLFLIGAILSLLSSLGEGGRTSVVNFGFYFIMCLSLREVIKGIRLPKLSHNQKYFILSAVAILVIILVWFTVSRSGDLLWKNNYLYFSMEPYMFDTWADRVDSLDLYGFGEASLNGFLFVPLYLIKNIFGIDFPDHWNSVYELIRLTDSEWVTITAQSTRANAYVSAFWFFYLDGRLAGIIIGFVIYGIVLAGYHQNMIKRANIKTISIFCFLVQGMIWTFIRFPFSNVYYCLALIYLTFVVFKPKI